MTGTPSSRNTREPGLHGEARAVGRAVRYRPQAVPRGEIEAILDLARRAPSGVNTQPWEIIVLQGPPLDAVLAYARSSVPQLLSDADAQARFWARFKCLPGAETWPGAAWESSGAGFIACADAAFGGGRLGGQGDLERYFDLDGAPAALMCTIDRILGLGSVLDYGMFLHNVVMAAAARGLCAEVMTGWRGLSGPVLDALGVAPGPILLAAVALGYAGPVDDGDAAPQREPSLPFVTWHA